MSGNYNSNETNENTYQFYWYCDAEQVLGTNQIALSVEYTTSELWTNTMADLGAWSDWSEGKQQGSSVLSSDESTLTVTQVKYRYYIDTAPNTTYEVTVGSSTTPVLVSGGADGGRKYIEDSSYESNPPNASGLGAPIPDATATIQGGGSCSASNGPSSPGGPGPMLSSVKIAMSLGSTTNGAGAGHLLVHQELPSAALSTPAVLRALTVAGVDVVTNGSGGVRQVKAPQCLADVVTNSALSYDVKFYASTNVGALTNGLYPTSGSPFLTWKIENPDGTGATTNQLRVIETRGAGSITNLFDYNTTNATWTFTSGNGLRKETKTSVWSATNTVLTTTNIMRSGATDALLSQEVKVEQLFSFGLKPTELRVGDGANVLTTTYTYYTNPTSDGGAFGQLKQTTHPNGSWEIREYATNGRIAKVFSSFLNQSPTNDASLCRVLEYDYTPLGGSGDDGTVKPEAYRTMIEKLLGTEVGRSYVIYKTNETRQIRCQTAGAAWDATDSLATITTTYTNGSFQNWTKSVRRPDGTMSIYEYEVDGSGNLSTLVWSGQPNGGGTAIVAGTKLVTLQGPLGNVIERTTVDIASDLITGSEVFSDFDEFGRPGRVTYLDSTFKLFTYLCCGLESETDRDGVTTLHSYDALKRRIATSRNGIAHLRTLDAAGQELLLQRQGTNASVITLASRVFDTAGERLYETNAVGKVTAFGRWVDGSGQTVRAVTNALGATVLTTLFKDGSVQSVTGTGTHGVRHEYGVESDLAYAKEIKLKDDGSDSGEWTKTFTDVAGRPFKTVFPDSAYVQSWFNAQGQLWKQRDADGVVTLRQYNALAELEYEAVDMDRNDTIDFAGTDRITRHARRVGTAASLASVNAFIAEKWVFTTDGATNQVLAVLSESAVDGTARAQTTFGLTNRSYHACGGTCASTNFAPDGSYSVSLKTDGYLTSVTRYDAGNAQLGATTYTYDEHGLQKTITDARNGTTTLIRDDLGRVTSATTPAPGGGQSAQTTTTYYDDGGNVWRVVKPDGTSVTNEFYLTREFKKKYGSQTYPEERTWDYAGRPKTLKTWQDFAGNAGVAVTTWNYSTNRGFLLSKQYQDGNGPSYTWTPGGKLETRTWARGVVTSNAFNNAMDLVAVDYSDSTPDVAFTYDRRGRQTSASASDYAATNYLTDSGQLLAELWTAGPLSSLAVTNTYDHLLRRTNLTLP
jgi:YD repeat-containing protein